MSTLKIVIPSVGESISEVSLIKWSKQTGDFVERDEVIAEIESEKASFEISAEKSGVLQAIVKEGDTLVVGDVIGEIDTKARGGKKQGKTDEKKDKKKISKQIDITIPEVGESISEVVLLAWKKTSGDFVERDEVIVEIESEKASFEISAEEAGTLTPIAKEGQTLQIGEVIATIAMDKTAPKKQKQQLASSSYPVPENDAKQDTHSTPLAKAVGKDMGISLADIAPQDAQGKIKKSDVLKFLTASQGERSTNKKKVTSLRKTIARRLVQAKNETAMLTTFNEVDMSAIMQMRKKYKEAFKEEYAVGLGFMSFFTRACCLALQQIPAVNAYLDGDHILYHNYCDISIAVSSPKGLVVPVIRSAEYMQMHEIEQSVLALAKKARDGKLSMEEMQGGTFTITNGGVFGSLLSTPILNPPQSAILGMHKIEERPVVVNKQVIVRPMMYLALSYDHRIIDGKESVTFLVKVKEMLENPTFLLTGKDPEQILVGL